MALCCCCQLTQRAKLKKGLAVSAWGQANGRGLPSRGRRQETIQQIRYFLRNVTIPVAAAAADFAAGVGGWVYSQLMLQLPRFTAAIITAGAAGCGIMSMGFELAS